MAVGAVRETVRPETPRDRRRSPSPQVALNGKPAPHSREACCGLYHRAIELVGKRWTGAILLVLMGGPLRFSEIKQLVPDLSDRLLSERLKELEAEGIVERRVIDGGPMHVEYRLTKMGRELEPTVRALKAWAHDWLC